MLRVSTCALVLAALTACGDDGARATDAGVDGGGRAHCRGRGPAPAWAEPAGAGVARVRCAGATLEVAALTGGVARVDRVADGAAIVERPWTAIAAPSPAADTSLAADGDDAELCAPDLAVTVTRDCRVEVRDDGGRVVLADGAGGGFTADAGGATLVHRAAEHVYGLGERTGRLDRRGRAFTFWNVDAYDSALGGWRPDADPLYLGIPFAITLDAGAAAGVLVDDSRRLTMDVGAADPARWQIRTPARALREYVLVGPSMKDVLGRYAALTGTTPLPPRWALGYHQSRWGYAPASRLTDLSGELRRRAIGADALWLDIQHLRGFRTFTFDPATFPDPAGLASSLAADGFRLVTIADPGLKVDPGWDVYDEALAGGHVLRRPGGAAYEGVVWPGPSVFPDFTRAETRAWWGAKIATLAARGVGGIWLDVNEPTTFPEDGGGATVPDELVAAGAPGATMAEVHNVYGRLEAEATWAGLRSAAPDRRPFVLSRAGAPGIQRWAAVWTGDAPSTWTSLDATLPMLLGLGLSGVPFVGSDVGGYSGGASGELFARWISLGSVSPFFRGHVTQGARDQEPWAFGGEVEEISRRAIAERYRRMPYLYSVFAEAEATGLPVLRPMVMEFQDDPATWTMDDQAMLGPSLLVAPVVAVGATNRRVYLPAGRWMELRSGATYDGPGSITVDVTLQALPTFVRAGGIVPGWQRGGDERGPLVLDVHAGADGAFVLHEDAGDGHGDARRIRYAVTSTATGATVRAERVGGTRPAAARTLIIRLRPVDGVVAGVTLDGAPLAGWSHDANDRALSISLPDRDAFTIEATFAAGAAPAKVRVPVEVRAPATTPAGAVVHVASDATGWTHVPLARVDATTWRGELDVDRGAWFHYKFTRGGWETVEKGADCAELPDRYRFGAADDVQVDTVARWRDGGCP